MRGTTRVFATPTKRSSIAHRSQTVGLACASDAGNGRSAVIATPHRGEPSASRSTPRPDPVRTGCQVVGRCAQDPTIDQ
jgi:hypothetical protein